MIQDPGLARIYTDFQGLTDLKREARRESSSALREVAEQFEAMFLRMLLKNMREASLGDGLFDSDQTRFYQDMFDQQLSIHLARGRGLGIADMLERQLGGKGLPPAGRSEADKAVPASGLEPGALPVRHEPLPSASESAPEPSPTFESREDFVRTLWPHAERVGRELGVKPEVLLAQAALETGWGRHVITAPDGRSSHNLFNIKADGRWNGERMMVSTLEYQDGVAVRQRASFRAYGSYAESFTDYADFLRSNPRYREALRQAGNAEAFVNELQRAGYATDPKYAEKISMILNSDVLNADSAGLKNAG